MTDGTGDLNRQFAEAIDNETSAIYPCDAEWLDRCAAACVEVARAALAQGEGSTPAARLTWNEYQRRYTPSAADLPADTPEPPHGIGLDGRCEECDGPEGGQPTDDELLARADELVTTHSGYMPRVVAFSDTEARELVAAVRDLASALRRKHEHHREALEQRNQAQQDYVRSDDAAAHLSDKVERLERELAEAERPVLQLIDERDANEEWADRLAAAIAPPGVLGEHSSANNPWQNALDYAAEARSHGEVLCDSIVENAGIVRMIPGALPGDLVRVLRLRRPVEDQEETDGE